MKKRSMLAIASLATGFVVAAVTPSHAIGEKLPAINVDETLKTLDQTVGKDGLSVAGKDGVQKKKGAQKKGAQKNKG
ncbi:hypothetical protein ACH4HG_23310 [Streptomyces coeruleorubidus]|jgi:hypothetical protein|uniref:Uncharacterized protein n=1 Tax=Streptomyces coeruleorubidus TaxID=116188 RepID=A0A5J6HYS7_STRC4|nr:MULTISPECIES: hypothetical protein [Streptomyces]QEV23571.1 hypothetical protein CP976_05030 [Streptomyces coeruleorubidus]WOT38672.1 hypothetical protein R5U08_32950 [Streptomyces coeruleorubidus]